jgi:hypothetical protein
MFLTVAFLILSTQGQPAPESVAVEACKVGLTEMGRRAYFQTHFVYEVVTDTAGHPRSIQILKEDLSQFVELAKLEDCIRRWRLVPASTYTVSLFAGTTGDALTGWRIAFRHASGSSVSIRLPRG